MYDEHFMHGVGLVVHSRCGVRNGRPAIVGVHGNDVTVDMANFRATPTVVGNKLPDTGQENRAFPDSSGPLVQDRLGGHQTMSDALVLHEF